MHIGAAGDLHCILEIGGNRGVQCFADGVQFSTECTLGRCNARLSIESLLMVSPPLVFMDFEGSAGLDCVIVGDQDEIAPVAGIRRMLTSWNPKAALEVIPGADHFFSGKVPVLESALRRHLDVFSPPFSP